MVNGLLVVVPTLSRTVTVAFDVPGTVGRPEITPTLEIVSPVGSPVAVHVNGGIPPVAVKLAE
jgi:hypothetical protein